MSQQAPYTIVVEPGPHHPGTSFKEVAIAEALRLARMYLRSVVHVYQGGTEVATKHPGLSLVHHRGDLEKYADMLRNRQIPKTVKR